MKLEELYLSCDCSCDEHTLRFQIDEEEGYIYTSVYLKTWFGFFQRVWVALKYIFGLSNNYGHFDCFMMSENDIPVMRELLDKYEKKRKEYKENQKKEYNCALCRDQYIAEDLLEGIRYLCPKCKEPVERK